MNVLCLSDTHGTLPELDLEGIDLVMHAGDFSPLVPKYDLNNQLLYFQNVFSPWARRILDKCNFFFCMGNHEMFAEILTYEDWKNDITEQCLLHDKAIFLHECVGWNSQIKIKTQTNPLCVYGSAFTPTFHFWGFNLDDTPEQLGRKFAAIPDDVDIILTHGPPLGILDTNLLNEHCGSKQLKDNLPRLKQLKLHVFGHLHSPFGVVLHNDVMFVNCCLCDEDYNPSRQPILVEL